MIKRMVSWGKIKTLLVSALLFAACNSLYAADWEQVDGPYDGNVTSFAKDTSTNKIYATGMGVGLGGGVFVSADNGNSWARVAGNSQLGDATANTPAHYGTFYEAIGLPAVSGLKAGNLKLGIDPSTTPNTLYVAYFYTGSPSKIMRSIDEGANWTLFTTGLAAGFQPHDFAYSSVTGDMYVAGFQGTGVYRLPDGGSTWVACTTTVTNAVAIAVDQINGDIYFTNLQNSIDPNRPAVYRSIDNGTSFAGVPISTSADTYSVGTFNRLLNSIAIDNSVTPPVIHLGLKDRYNWFNETYIATGGHFRSTDYGATWTSGTARNVESMAVDSTGRVFLGARDNATYFGEIYVSNDRGITFTKINEPGINDAASVLGLYACAPNTVFAGADGAYRSTDNGATWTHLDNRGLKACRRTTDVAVDTDGTLYSASNEHGVSRSDDGGTTWVIANGSGASRLGSMYVNTIAVDPVTHYVFAGTGLVDTAPTGIWRSTDKGATWAKVSGYSCSYKGMDIVFARNGNVIFGGMFLGPGGAFYSANSGASAIQSANPYLDPIYSLAVDPVSGDIYAGTETKATWRSTDNGLSFQELTWIYASTNGCNGTQQGNKGNIFSIAVDSTGNTVYEVALRGLYKTNDKGVTWQEVAVPGLGGCGQTGQAVITDPNNYVYYHYTEGAASPPRLKRSVDSGASWTDFNSGLPSDSRSLVGTQSMLYNPSDGKLYTGMSSNTANIKQGAAGLYRTLLPVYAVSTATPSATLAQTFTPTQTGTNTNTATQTFTQTATQTPTNTSSQTATNTPTMTWTSSDTATNTFTNTPTNTPTESHTLTRTQTPTNTVTATHTNSPTDSPTLTYTQTPTNTPTQSFTRTVTNTATETPTSTITDTATVTFTPTETVTGSPLPTWTYTNTPTNSATWTDTYTSTPTETETATATDTFTFTSTATLTHTATLTNSETASGTETPTWTPTDTFTSTVTQTPTLTATGVATNTFTLTGTRTNTLTNTPTNTFTQTYTYTATMTMTATPSLTLTASQTYTSTCACGTFTPTPTPTATAPATGTLSITDTLAYPNPVVGSAKLHIECTGQPIKARLKIYSSSFRLLVKLDFEQADITGAYEVTLPQEVFADKSNGVYYYLLTAQDAAGNEAKAKVKPLVILR